MSGIVHGAVLQHGPRSAGLTFTLSAIAESADDHGFAVLSLDSIALKIRKDVRTAIRHIEQLEKDGWLRVEHRVLGKGNVYFINIERLKVVLNAKSKRSELWDEVERLLLERERRKAGVQKRLKLAWVVDEEPAATTENLFASGDKMSPQTDGEKPAEKSAEVTFSAIEVTKNSVSGDKNASLNKKNRINLEPFKNIPPTPASGGAAHALPFLDCMHGSAEFNREVGLAARHVVDACELGLNSRLKHVIEQALSRRAKTREEGLAAVTAMAIGNYKLYLASLPDLRWGPWKPKTFFESGYWQEPETWPWDQAKRAAKTAAAVGARRDSLSDGKDEADRKAAQVYLERNAAAVALAGHATFAARLDELQAEAASGDLSAIEKALQDLEEELVEAIKAKASDDELAEIAARADKELAAYRGKMSATQIAIVKEQWIYKQLLEAAKIPRLSMFYMKGGPR